MTKIFKYFAFIFCFIFIFPYLILSQKDTIERNNDKFIYDLSIRLNTAFSFGIEGGAGKIWKEKTKERPKKKKGEEFLLKKQTQLLIFGRLGIEGGAQTFTGINNNFGITFRKIRNEKAYTDFSFSPVGCFGSIYGETYSVNEYGEVKKKSLSGRIYYSPSFSYSFGRASKLNAFESWFLRFNYTFLIPYNTSFLPMFNIAFGYNLK